MTWSDTFVFVSSSRLQLRPLLCCRQVRAGSLVPLAWARPSLDTTSDVGIIQRSPIHSGHQSMGPPLHLLQLFHWLPNCCHRRERGTESPESRNGSSSHCTQNVKPALEVTTRWVFDDACQFHDASLLRRRRDQNGCRSDSFIYTQAGRGCGLPSAANCCAVKRLPCQTPENGRLLRLCVINTFAKWRWANSLKFGPKHVPSVRVQALSWLDAWRQCCKNTGIEQDR